MQIRKPRSWELPDSVVTPEAQYLRRRDFLRAGSRNCRHGHFPPAIRAATAGFPDALDPAYKLDGVKLTPYNLIPATTISTNGDSRKAGPKELANKGWKTEPWTVEIGGLCRNPAN